MNVKSQEKRYCKTKNQSEKPSQEAKVQCRGVSFQRKAGITVERKTPVEDVMVVRENEVGDY